MAPLEALPFPLRLAQAVASLAGTITQDVACLQVGARGLACCVHPVFTPPNLALTHQVAPRRRHAARCALVRVCAVAVGVVGYLWRRGEADMRACGRHTATCCSAAAAVASRRR
jgi:hypothetical protein